MVDFAGSNVVVTGGTGALGKAVIAALRAAGAVSTMYAPAPTAAMRITMTAMAATSLLLMRLLFVGAPLSGAALVSIRFRPNPLPSNSRDSATIFSIVS